MSERLIPEIMLPLPDYYITLVGSVSYYIAAVFRGARFTVFYNNCYYY